MKMYRILALIAYLLVSSSVHGVMLTQQEMIRARLITTTVERKAPQMEVRMYGVVDYDETRIDYVTAWVGGRIEKMYLNYTGVPVNAGDHMVELYSPELLTSQKELIESLRMLAREDIDEGSFVHLRAQANVESAKEKLRLFGLAESQIAQIATQADVTETVTIPSPITGVVVQKNVEEGNYVQRGSKLYTVADLSEVWVMLQAYESDLHWLRYGQTVSFKTRAISGQVFEGKIAYIAPFMDQKSRTAMVRVNVSNDDGQLKPGMYLQAIVRPVLSSAGDVQAPELEGKWIGPMHPYVTQDQPGACPICGMPLVDAKSLGYGSVTDSEAKLPLVIPASAPLISGKRAIVYVQHPEHLGHFSLRQVTLGPRAGDQYIVLKGLSEGEKVATNGNFALDSAAQIRGEPSMMRPEGGKKMMEGHSNH